MTNTAPTLLEIIAGNSFLIAQIERLKRVVNFLQPFSSAFLAASVAGWMLVIVLLFQNELRWAGWIVAIVAMLSVLALGLPRWVDDLSAEIETNATDLTGEQATAELLQSILNANWTLFQTITLPDQLGDLNGILIGSAGVYLLEVETLAETHQSIGPKWLRRTHDNDWELAKHNPTRQAQRNADRLQRWFKQHDLTVDVQPRVVWAGDGLILQDAPSIPIWQVRQPEPIQEELLVLGKDVISAETHSQLKQLLQTVIKSAETTPQLAQTLLLD